MRENHLERFEYECICIILIEKTIHLGSLSGYITEVYVVSDKKEHHVNQSDKNAIICITRLYMGHGINNRTSY